jgi:hypothetical protein
MDINKKQRYYMTFSLEENPWTGAGFFTHRTQCMEHFFPRDILSASAQKFTDVKESCEELLNLHLDIQSLFLYLYFSCYEKIFLPSRRGPKKNENKNKRQKVNHGNGDGDGDGYGNDEDGNIPRLEQEQEEEDDDEIDATIRASNSQSSATNPNKINRLDNVSASCIFATLEKVEDRTHNRDCAGIRLRLGNNVPDHTFEFGSRVWGLLKNNEKRLTMETKTGKKKINITYQRYQKLTFERYWQIVSLYTGIGVSRLKVLQDDVKNPQTNVHPCNVFSIDRSLGLAKRANASPAYYNAALYFNSETLSRTYAVPKNVYFLSEKYMHPETFHDYLFPYIQKPEENDTQRLIFQKYWVPDDADDPELCGLENQHNVSPERLQTAKQAARLELGSLYDMYNKVKLTDSNTMTFDGLKRRTEFRRAKARQIAGEDKEKYRKLNFQVQMEGIKEFAQIFQPEGDIPPSLKHICRWLDKHFLKNKHLGMPIKKKTRNMSRYADTKISFASQMEAVFGVNTLQAEIACLFSKNMHVYSGHCFHPHSLYYGPAKVGKTFIFNVLIMLIIVGTFGEYAYFSKKANAAPGQEYDKLIEILEEAPPSMLCRAGGAKHNDSGAEDARALLKLKLTKGKVRVRINAPDPHDIKKRLVMETEGKANCCMNFAVNEPLRNIDPPTATRFHCKNVPIRDRADGGLFVKMQVTASGKFDRIKHLLTYRSQRNQALICIVFSLLEVSILEPIDLTAAFIIYHEMLKRAREYGLTGAEDVRNFERLLFVTQSEVIQDAIDLLFDSELSPFKDGRSFQYKDLLLIEPYLKASVENCVFTAGLLRDQYESPVLKSLIKALVDKLFAEAIRIDKEDKPPHPNLAAELTQEGHNNQTGLHHYSAETQQKMKENDQYYAQKTSMYYVIDFPSKTDVEKQRAVLNSSSSSSSSSHYRQHQKYDLTRLMRDCLHPHMNPRPQVEDTEHAIDLLTQLPVQNSNGEITGGDFALELRDGKAFLAKSIINSVANATLKAILTDVLERLTINQRQYIYGQAYEARPYIFDHIVVKPKKSTFEPIDVVDPMYVDDAVKDLTLAACENVDDECDPHELAKVFSTYPTIRIDESLDKYVAVRRLHTIGVNSKDLVGLPSVIPSQFRKDVIASLTNKDRDSLQPYPNYFPLTMEQQTQERKRKADTVECSAKYQTDQIIAKMGYDIGEDEDDDDICEVSNAVEKELDDHTLADLAANEDTRLEKLANVTDDSDDSDDLNSTALDQVNISTNSNSNSNNNNKNSKAEIEIENNNNNEEDYYEHKYDDDDNDTNNGGGGGDYDIDLYNHYYNNQPSSQPIENNNSNNLDIEDDYTSNIKAVTVLRNDPVSRSIRRNL